MKMYALTTKDRKGWLEQQNVNSMFVVATGTGFDSDEQVDWLNKQDVRHVFKFTSKLYRLKVFASPEEAMLHLDAMLEHLRIWEQSHKRSQHILSTKCRVFIDGMYAVEVMDM